MPERAAIVTGASRGIGLALAEFLADRGYALTVSARRPEGLRDAAAALRDRGAEVEAVPANMADEAAVRELVARHEARFGRLDLLVNNAGVGIGAAADEHQTKLVDLQLAVNVRAIVLMYRECAALLRAAGAEHRTARVVNLASIAGRDPQPWLSVYSATKAAVIAYTTAMNRELSGDGVLSTAICPGFVNTDMSEFVKASIPAEQMLTTSDVTAALGFLLSTSPACLVPELVLGRPGAEV
jgi:NAD(P)-dependent dehydrogenase (short-subunit alcohol dehydrogenase family)